MTLQFTQQQQHSSRRDNEREVLLAVMREENANLTTVAEAFYATPKRDEAVCCHYSQKIIATVDRILAAGDWETSLFLRNLIKPIKQIREDAVVLLEQNSGAQQLPVTDELTDAQMHVYVSLFQIEGSDLKKWHLQLKSIECNLVGRPIYAEKKFVEESIRSKMDVVNEAYIKVVVDKDLIRQPSVFEKRKFDKNNNPLLMLEQGSILYHDIIEFVHNEQTYTVTDGELIEKITS